MEIYTYSPEDVFFSLGDMKLGDWDSIRISALEPSYRLIRGINNKNTRAKVSGSCVEIKISVLQASQTNWIFSEINRLDNLQGAGRLELFIKDQSGQSYFSSLDAFIAGKPEQMYTGELELLEWTIICQTIQDWSIAGNASPSESALSSFINNAIALF